MSSLRIVLGTDTFVNYQGGGHWSWLLQYALGLRAIGHTVLWLELFHSSADQAADHKRLRAFFTRMEHYGLHNNCAVLSFPLHSTETLADALSFGWEKNKVADFIRDADLLWNFSCAFKKSLLSLFKHPVLIDVDPGHLQISAAEFDQLDILEHKTYLTVGSRINSDDCKIPHLGVTWHGFFPFVYLPLWKASEDAGPLAPFSTITHWTWEEFWLKDRVLSVSKRTAYLRYLELPRMVRRPFELAAHFHPLDNTGDRELLREHGWLLADPTRVADSPESYRKYICGSRAELLCPKPIFKDLITGWMSDRSVCYLASARPVLAEETGFSNVVPTGDGLLAFSSIKEAVAGVQEIDGNYARHSAAARALAEDVFNSAVCLPRMLAACGV